MIESLFEQMFIALPLVFGAYLILSLLKLPDFSLEGSYLFGAVMAYLSRDLPFPIPFLAAIIGGILIGSLMFFLHQIFRLPYLLAAVVMNGFVHGITLALLKSAVNAFHLTLPMSEISFLAGISLLVVVASFLLLRSQMGFCFSIYGKQPEFFDAHQISRRFVLLSGILTGHSLAALSGSLFAITSGILDVTMNFGVLLLCLVSLIIGKQIQRRELPKIAVPLFGIACYFLMQQMLLRVGLNLKYFNGFQAGVIFLILLFSGRKNKMNLNQLGV